MNFEQKGKEVGGDMGRKADQASNSMGNSFDKMKEGAKEGMQNAKEGVQKMVDNVKDKAYDMKDQACEYTDKVADRVKKDPMQALAIAVGLGLVIGMLLKS